ncbi:MAG: HAD-superfamily hydrolase subfamily variant 3 [Mycobacterium sp.]|nr:HAD-superfamily hydrolase subfamily variant 3 [Mycobacterium sp.]
MTTSTGTGFDTTVTGAVAAVAFDMGGVLTHTSFGGLEAYAQTLGLPEGLLTSYFRGHPKMVLLETAKISSREFFKFVCADSEQRTGTRLDIRELASAAAKGEVLNPAMLELVAEVHRDCTTALLTNNVAEAGWRVTFPFDLFDVVIDSSQVGVRKPDPRIYEELIRRLDLPAETIAFIDDLPENLPPAARLGIRTVLFTGADELRSALTKMGALGTTAR